MEVSNKNQIIQTMGLKNCAPSKEIQEFVELFKKQKLIMKGKKSA